MNIPIINGRAFGTVSTFGTQQSAPPVRLGGPTQPMSQIRSDRTDKAFVHYEGVKRNYDNLVVLMGQEAADIALEEARRAAL